MFKAADGAIQDLTIDTIKTLSIDAVQKANSGHPGTPMALAPAAYVLWTRFLRYNPKNPKWLGRDRFILSCGHASMLLYSLLYLTGFGLELEDLENFRQLDSLTPGHPENFHTAGVETTTGPLGQGVANGVGMALSEKMMAARYNKPNYEICDSTIYGLCSDGDLMEGVSAEAASLAGHLELGNLVFIYDNNHITIDGATSLAFTEDVPKRFDAYGWHTQILDDQVSLDDIEAAVRLAKEDKRPSLISLRTHIADGSPNLHDTSKAHGAPFGDEEVRLTKENIGWPADKQFYVPDEVLAHMRSAQELGEQLESEWEELFTGYGNEHPGLAAEWQRVHARKLPDGWAEGLPEFKPDDKIATRSASGQTINAIAANVPEFVGGSADLAGSTSTALKGLGDVGPGSYEGRNLHFGVREHGMGGVLNGMVEFGGLRVFGSTFLIFSDYMRASVRLAALTGSPTLFVYTHDSFFLGEDGPTHQPVEHYMALRAIPNLIFIRPGDGNETVAAWKAAVENDSGPTAMAFTRQGLPTLVDPQMAANLSKGAYVLKDCDGTPELIVIGTGSEIHLAYEAVEQLQSEGVSARAVSMPCWELFETQDQGYRDQILPPEVSARVAVEAGIRMGWERYIGINGGSVTIDHYGASAPAGQLAEKFGFTAENVVQVAKETLARTKE